MSLRILRPVCGLRAASRPLTRRCVHSTPSAQTPAQTPADRPRHDRPFRLAVVGSGPAGFYTAYRVMSLVDGAKVDMYEALPVPYGLVRFGVAPDHPEVKVGITCLELSIRPTTDLVD